MVSPHRPITENDIILKQGHNFEYFQLSITGATNAVALSTTSVISASECRTFFLGVTSTISTSSITGVIGKSDHVEKWHWKKIEN